MRNGPKPRSNERDGLSRRRLAEVKRYNARASFMIYLERIPAAPLMPFVRMLWYASMPTVSHRYERILPNGCAQAIWNLSRDYLWECQEDGPAQPIAPALLVGQRSIYEVIATSDLADLIGVVFETGALPHFAAERADLFSNQSVPLDQILGAQGIDLRSRMQELRSPVDRMQLLESWLMETFASKLDGGVSLLHPAVSFALSQFGGNSPARAVAEVARQTGWSERRFSQLFREQVGFRPKVWLRIQRFQRAVRGMRRGAEISLAQLAADCYFYDQAHFANEFRSFSGLDITTYNERRHKLWANHTQTD